MNNLEELLKRVTVNEIEYIYPERIQAKLDALDSDIGNITKAVAEAYQQLQNTASTARIKQEAAELHMHYHGLVGPLLAQKAHLVACTVPKVVIHTTEKPTLY